MPASQAFIASTQCPTEVKSTRPVEHNVGSDGMVRAKIVTNDHKQLNSHWTEREGVFHRQLTACAREFDIPKRETSDPRLTFQKEAPSVRDMRCANNRLSLAILERHQAASVSFTALG